MIFLCFSERCHGNMCNLNVIVVLDYISRDLYLLFAILFSSKFQNSVFYQHMRPKSGLKSPRPFIIFTFLLLPYVYKAKHITFNYTLLNYRYSAIIEPNFILQRCLIIPTYPLSNNFNLIFLQNSNLFSSQSVVRCDIVSPGNST